MRNYCIALSTFLLFACGEQAPIPVEAVVEGASGNEALTQASPQNAAVPDATEVPVTRVESVMISRLNGRTDTVLILAAGSVNSDGWSEARLEPVEPTEGQTTRVFSFVATSPEKSDGPQGAQTIEARIEIPDLPPEVDMVRVVAETNELTAFVGN